MTQFALSERALAEYATYKQDVSSAFDFGNRE